MRFKKWQRYAPLYAALLGTLAGCSDRVEEATVSSAASKDAVAHFSWFEYQGRDPVFDAPLSDDEFQNPILAGFYPDPSITRAGDYYYLANSSFAFSPGVPIFRSTDMVNWESLGHALTSPAQLPLAEQQTSRGIYAPTIRHHDGVFYLITTLVDIRGNFIVTATDPAGPWSEPVLLPEIGGIDPDIFFDDDGRVYITHHHDPAGGSQYEGHKAIWLWEYDLANNKVIADSGRMVVDGGADPSSKPVWIEAPHIFKKDGWYYLTCAEGGTEYNHSQVIFRTRNLAEPFVPFAGNPILTQRDLNRERPNPITNTGHADFIETPNGEWWAVFLASRSYNGSLFNTGRETFLLPVRWEDGWPIILDPQTEVAWRPKKPTGLKPMPASEPFTGNFTWRDAFSGDALQHHWNQLRQPDHSWYTLGGKKGGITLNVRPASLAELTQVSFIGRRQQHMHFSSSTEVTAPQSHAVIAGLTVFQNEKHHFFAGVSQASGKYELVLEQANNSEPQVIQRLPLEKLTAGQPLIIGSEGDAGLISFYYQLPGEAKVMIAEGLDASMLSSEIAGGFIGTHIGLHARINRH